MGSVTTANHFGGHELPGQRPDRLSNFIPNYTEYPIADSLASWYKIMIASSHTRTISEFNEQDATLAEQWWAKDTGSNQGDRCIFMSGDDAMNTLLNTTGVVTTLQQSLATNVFGVASVTNAWAGSTSTPYPTIDDRFAAASAGPALAAANTFTYPVDGGCPGPNSSIAITEGQGPADVADCGCFYPIFMASDVGIGAPEHAQRGEDAVTDKDRNKALSYGFSIQFVRDPGYRTANANYIALRRSKPDADSVQVPSRAAVAPVRPHWRIRQVLAVPDRSTLALMQATGHGQSPGSDRNVRYALLRDPGLRGGDGRSTWRRSRCAEVNSSTATSRTRSTRRRDPLLQARAGGQGDVADLQRGWSLVRRCTTNVTVGANEDAGTVEKRTATQLASGVYFYKIVFPNGESVHAPNNLVLVK